MGETAATDGGVKGREKERRERNGPVDKPLKEKGELPESCPSLKEQDAAQVGKGWSYIGAETIHHPA